MDPQPDVVYLRVPWRSVCQLPACDARNLVIVSLLDPDRRSSGHLYAIKAELARIHNLSQTADWLIKVTILLFEPRRNGSLLTFSGGGVEYWYGRDRDASWRVVEENEIISATIYEFRGEAEPLTLSRRCLRQSHSVTSQSRREDSTTFRNQILARDLSCPVSNVADPYAVTASHLIPKRLGDPCIQAIVKFYAGEVAAQLIDHRFHPALGILLYTPIDRRVDTFTVGFYRGDNDPPHHYQAHLFEPQTDVISTYGHPVPNFPPLHRHAINLISHDDTPLPAAGTIDWHYLQCVIRWFATEEYEAVPNINYPEQPFKTEDDLDAEFDNNGEGVFFDQEYAIPPYPSFYHDKALYEEAQALEAQETTDRVAEWTSNLPIEE